MSKKRRAIWIVLVIVVIILSLNYFVSFKIKERFEVEIDKVVENLPDNISLTYDRAYCIPILWKMGIKGIEIVEDKEDINIVAKKFAGRLGYKDWIEIILKRKDAEISHLNLEIKDSNISMPKRNRELDYSNIKFILNGSVVLSQLIDNPEVLLEKRQNIRVECDEFKLQYPQKLNQILKLNGNSDDFNNIDKFFLDFIYDPLKKEVDIKECRIKSPLLNFNMSNTIKYAGGSSIADVIITAIKAKTDIKINGGGLKLGEIYFKSNFSISNLDQDLIGYLSNGFSWAWQDGYKNIDSGEFYVKVKDVRAEFPDSIKEKLLYYPSILLEGVDLTNVFIENSTLRFKLSDYNLNLEELKIDSSLVKLDAIGNIEINYTNPYDTLFDDMVVRIDRFTPELQGILESFDSKGGKDILGEGEIIVLEVSGTLRDLEIKKSVEKNEE